MSSEFGISGIVLNQIDLWLGDTDLTKITTCSHKGKPIPLAAVAILLGATSCGGTVAFQGQKAFAVSGSSPAPAASVAAPASKHVAVNANKIEIDEKIQFEHDQATILPASFGLLSEVTQVLKDNPNIKKVLIEGHASSEGDASHNTKLSDDRAKSVMKYIVDHGVDKARLSAKGFGSSQPVADNKTEDGREKNRRVEFTILEPALSGGAK